MHRIAISELTTLRWPFEEDVARIHRMGFGAIGIWREKLSDYGEEKGAELIRETGLTVSSLQWAGGFTGSDGRSFAEAIADGVEAISIAAQLNADCLIVHPGSRGGHTHSHAFRLLNSALDELVPVAREAGVRMAIEPMHIAVADDWTLLTSIEECIGVLDQFDSRVLGMVFDMYHLGHEANLCDKIRRYVDRIFLVQIADCDCEPCDEPNRCLLGNGRLKLLEAILGFESAGYRGYYEVELLGEQLEPLSYKDILSHTHEVLFSAYSGINSRHTK